MRFTAILAVLVLALACVSLFLVTKPGKDPETVDSVALPEPAQPEPSIPDVPDRQFPAPSPDRVKLASDGNAFAVDMYQRLRGQEGNLFFSPYSVSSALAMAYSGAKTKTAEDMRQTLRLSLPDERLFEAFSAQIEEANDPNKPFALDIANSLWGQSKLQYKKEFLDLTQKKFGAGLRPVDFQGAPAEACKEINAWVSEKTRGKIREIVKPEMISEMLRLILVNAIYFKGDWENKFEKDFTIDEPFYDPKPVAKLVPLMRQTETFSYADDGVVQVLGMPYKGNELSMIAVLPKKRDGLPAVEGNLRPELLDKWQGMLSPQRVEVWFPKFKLETDYDLAPDLRAMGMALAFNPTGADFSGMLDPKLGRLFISFVIHKAFVEVNEKGTEAAAATAVGMELASARMPEPVPVFRADHPFLFMIREDRTGAILFMGRFTRPL